MEGQVPEVTAWLRALYGSEALPASGVLHVTSASPELRVLTIGPGAPKSEGDFFLLNLARARADAVLTTGAIVRAEPNYRAALAGPQAAALARYRREVLAKGEPPVCAVLTRDGDLPLAHPLWDDQAGKLVLTVPERAPELARELTGRAEVIAIADLDARRAVDALRARGARLISIEAGPSANRVLYEPPSLVDELSLSIYEGPRVQLASALSPRLFAGMTCVSELQRQELSGPWRYQRWLRNR